MVDDEPSIAWAIGEFLKAYRFRNVWEAGDGLECMEFLRDHTHDVAMVVLDISMPKLDGLGVIRTLVKENHHTVGIILMTGWPTHELLEQWPSFGNENVRILGFFEKPFELADLLATVRDGMKEVVAARASKEH